MKTSSFGLKKKSNDPSFKSFIFQSVNFSTNNNLILNSIQENKRSKKKKKKREKINSLRDYTRNLFFFFYLFAKRVVNPRFRKKKARTKILLKMTKKRNISYREKNWGKKRERNPALFAVKTKKKKKLKKKSRGHLLT